MAESTRLAAERHEFILAAVRMRGTVRLADLVAQLGASPVTVRRDVRALADRGLVVRVHGGVTMPRHEPRDGEPATRSAVGPIAARALVGMVAPSMEYYWPTIINGVQAAVAAAGGRLVLRASSYDAVEDRRQVSRLLERGVQTLIVGPTVLGGPGIDLLRWLGGLPVPVVLVERRPPPELPTLALDAAYTDHAVGAGLGVRHLATLGHRRIGLLTSRHNVTSPPVREGWSAAVSSLGLPAGLLDLDVPSYGSPGWVQAYDEVLDTCRATGVGALLVHSDREAIGIVERARDQGMTVPGDLAVVSYDDVVAAASDPPLTAVHPEKHQLGVLAAELALARLAAGGARPVHRVGIWPTLMVRESCGAVAPTTR